MMFYKILAFSAIPFCAIFANPYEFPERTQTVTVRYASEADAQKALLTPCRLYRNKAVAWTHRSDDSDWRHLRTQKTLGAQGYYTTVYLNAVADKYLPLLKEVLALGAAVGNHTLNHPVIAELIPNEIYDQIVTHQAVVESAADQTSVSYTAPFCSFGTKVDPMAAKYIGESLRRAQIFYTADRTPKGIAAHYGLDPKSFFSAVNLHHTWQYSVKSYDDAMKHYYEKTKKNRFEPHMTHGMHSWHNDKTIKTLSDALAKYAKNPEIWYVNTTDYAAYTLSFFHADVKKHVNGKTAVFTLTRFRPADIGSKIPLTVSISGKPLSVEADGTAVSPDNTVFRTPDLADTTCYELPVSGHTPKAVETLAAGKKPAKLPPVAGRLVFRPKTNSLEFELTNGTEADLTEIYVTLKAPLKWKKGLYPFYRKTLPAGKTERFRADLGTLDEHAICAEGDLAFLAKCDFNKNGETFRAYVPEKTPGVFHKFACLRDCYRMLGPMKENAFSPDSLAALSKPENPLTNIGTGLTQTWRNGGDRSDREFKMRLNPQDKQKQWKAEGREIWKNPKIAAVRFLAIDFEAPEAGKYYLIGSRNSIRELWLNGEKTDFDRSNKWVEKDKLFPLKKGKNRLILVHKMNGNRWQAGQDSYSMSILDENRRPACRFTEVKVK